MTWGFIRLPLRAVVRAVVRAIVRAIAAISLLAACSNSSPDPVTSPTPSVASSTPTAPASPTATAPALPEAKLTPDGAVAFVEYFWDAYNYAFDALDPRVLEEISDPACRFCSSAIDDIKTLATSDAQGTGGDVKIIDAASPPAKLTTGTLVITTVSQTPEVVIQGGKTTKDPGYKQIRVDFSVIWTGSAWRIEGVAPDKEHGVRWPV